jgi:hypothetical protein
MNLNHTSNWAKLKKIITGRKDPLHRQMGLATWMIFHKSLALCFLQRKIKERKGHLQNYLCVSDRLCRTYN